MIADRSGVYTCQVCSRYEPVLKHPVVCNQSFAEFFVTDFNTGLDLVGPIIGEREEDTEGYVIITYYVRYGTISSYKRIRIWCNLKWKEIYE